MDNKSIAKRIVGKLLEKPADHIKEITAGTDPALETLFGDPIDPIKDPDLATKTNPQDREDRKKMVLPEDDVENEDSNGDESDLEKDLDQGYSVDKEDMYTGSGDGKVIT